MQSWRRLALIPAAMRARIAEIAGRRLALGGHRTESEYDHQDEIPHWGSHGAGQGGEVGHCGTPFVINQTGQGRCRMILLGAESVVESRLSLIVPGMTTRQVLHDGKVDVNILSEYWEREV